MPNVPYRKQGEPAAYLEGVGLRLAWFREVVGWTQTQLAKAAGVDQSTWAKWEAGKRLASVSHIARLCDPLGLSLDYVYRAKIGGLLRRDVELLLVARHPELVLLDRQEETRRARAEAPAA
jgi:transcriptional regulator with XRE-family HTH domain